MYFNDNSTKKFMCNTQYRSSYYNGIAFLWKSTMCCDLTSYMYSKRGTFINPLTTVVRIIHARSNTAAEHPLTVVVMTLAFRDDRTRGFAVVSREGSSRSTDFHRLYYVHVNWIKTSNHQGPPCPAIGIRGVRTPRRGQLNAGDHPKYRRKPKHFQWTRSG